jgi:hypothetical protein
LGAARRGRRKLLTCDWGWEWEQVEVAARERKRSRRKSRVGMAAGILARSLAAGAGIWTGLDWAVGEED